MARKSEGTARKSTSPRKSAAKQPNPVTPIREVNVAVGENGVSQIPPGIEEEIRMRAYELYLERGGLDGFDQEDWHQAEMEILSKYHTEKSA